MWFRVIFLVLIAIPQFHCTKAKSKDRSQKVPDPKGGQFDYPIVYPSPSSVPGTGAPQNSIMGDCYRADEETCNAEKQIAEMTNQVRRSSNRPPLSFDPKISFAARLWSVQQGTSGVIGHAGFPRVRLRTLIDEFGNRSLPSLSAENVAMSMLGRSSNPTKVAEAFIRMWVNSSGHFGNMIGPHQTIGVGVHQSPDGRVYATQIFGN